MKKLLILNFVLFINSYGKLSDTNNILHKELTENLDTGFSNLFIDR